jgi:pilus assembly protein CpaB
VRTTRLNPTLRDRLHGLLPSGHGARLLWARRVVAAVLVLIAAVLAFRPLPGTDTVQVLVAAHDLAPGHLLTRGDIARRAIPANVAPGGVVHDIAGAEGRVLSGAARAGEPITDVRLAGPALMLLTVGDDAHAAVPIRLADPGVADLLYPGRRVDVVAADSGSGNGVVLAERAPVIAVRPAEDRQSKGRLVVVGLPHAQAAAVASASLTQSVTVTLR